MDVLKKLFEQHFRAPVTRVQPLQGQLGGSGRSIIRLSNSNHSAVGILYGVREENVAFLEFSRYFRRRGLPVPEIYAEELDHGAYLEEDLGDLTLFDFLSQKRAGEDIPLAVVGAYRQVLEILPRFQIEAGRDLNYKVCYPRASFDRQSIIWDLNYFKYYFLRLAGIPFNEQALEEDFTRLTKFLLSADHDYFLYRDFQSRNIMLCGKSPYFVDYQGGRKGALHPVLLWICLCPADAGVRRLRIPRILRAKVTLPAKRSICPEEPPLAPAQCGTSDCASDPHGILSGDAAFREVAEPAF
jgi:hypothetical protein